MKTCLHVLNDGGDIAEPNRTLIVLIPKAENPRKVTEFRIISLCNVIYKIITKSITNRIKTILDQIISLFQSAFIPQRQITDNIVVSYECLHQITNKQRGRKGLVVLKLDVSKAYDRLEWSFLKQTMIKFGFSRRLVNLIMCCVSTTTFNICLNGEVTDAIHPQ